MENTSKREKFLFWLIKNSQKWWLWLPAILAASALVNVGSGLLGGLGLIIWGTLTFAAGIDFTLETKLGKSYIIKDIPKTK